MLGMRGKVGKHGVGGCQGFAPRASALSSGLLRRLSKAMVGGKLGVVGRVCGVAKLR